jgi:hypothetical protein
MHSAMPHSMKHQKKGSTMYTIRYYAADETMGDTSPTACDRYRDWAGATLKTRYPQHMIEVWNTPSLDQAWTDDEAHRDQILETCARLWDMCQWDWEDVDEESL